LKIADRTGGDRSVTDLPYDDRLKVSAVPIDMYGDAIKASGSFHVTAFDLDDPADPTIGQWDFPLSDAEKNWFGKLFLYNYILECPWQKVPRHGELTIKVVFLDALTQRELEAQTIIHVTPPPPNSVATISPTTKP
jgi:hypothetical protein